MTYITTLTIGIIIGIAIRPILAEWLQRLGDYDRWMPS